jgi:hypothetical protein
MLLSGISCVVQQRCNERGAMYGPVHPKNSRGWDLATVLLGLGGILEQGVLGNIATKAWDLALFVHFLYIASDCRLFSLHCQ